MFTVVASSGYVGSAWRVCGTFSEEDEAIAYAKQKEDPDDILSPNHVVRIWEHDLPIRIIGRGKMGGASVDFPTPIDSPQRWAYLKNPYAIGYWQGGTKATMSKSYYFLVYDSSTDASMERIDMTAENLRQLCPWMYAAIMAQWNPDDNPIRVHVVVGEINYWAGTWDGQDQSTIDMAL